MTLNSKQAKKPNALQICKLIHKQNNKEFVISELCNQNACV